MSYLSFYHSWPVWSPRETQYMLTEVGDLVSEAVLGIVSAGGRLWPVLWTQGLIQ